METLAFGAFVAFVAFVLVALGIAAAAERFRKHLVETTKAEAEAKVQAAEAQAEAQVLVAKLRAAEAQGNYAHVARSVRRLQRAARGLLARRQLLKESHLKEWAAAKENADALNARVKNTMASLEAEGYNMRKGVKGTAVATLSLKLTETGETAMSRTSSPASPVYDPPPRSPRALPRLEAMVNKRLQSKIADIGAARRRRRLPSLPAGNADLEPEARNDEETEEKYNVQCKNLNVRAKAKILAIRLNLESLERKNLSK